MDWNLKFIQHFRILWNSRWAQVVYRELLFKDIVIEIHGWETENVSINWMEVSIQRKKRPTGGRIEASQEISFASFASLAYLESARGCENGGQGYAQSPQLQQSISIIWKIAPSVTPAGRALYSAFQSLFFIWAAGGRNPTLHIQFWHLQAWLVAPLTKNMIRTMHQCSLGLIFLLALFQFLQEILVFWGFAWGRYLLSTEGTTSILFEKATCFTIF